MWSISEDHSKTAGRSHTDAAFGRIDRVEIGHEQCGAWMDARNAAPDRLSVGCPLYAQFERRISASREEFSRASEGSRPRNRYRRTFFSDCQTRSL